MRIDAAAPVVSIIIAVKQWAALDIRRLTSSVAALSFANRIELIFIFSADSPECEVNACRGEIGAVKFVFAPPVGVYEAFSSGVLVAEGVYILFFGGDDFALPPLDNVVARVIEAREPRPVAYICPVLFGDAGVLRPIKSKIGLVFRNWCQQGVLYRRDIFEMVGFDFTYRIQADHKFNIEVVACGEVVERLEWVVAYFSCGGMSQTLPDLPFWRDMPDIVARNFGWLYGAVSRLRRLVGRALYGDPARRFERSR